MATELLLATTRFTARSVPLLRGDVVLSSHDGVGNLAGLTDRQLDWLIDTHPTYWEELILGRRFARDRRQRGTGVPSCARSDADAAPNPADVTQAVMPSIAMVHSHNNPRADLLSISSSEPSPTRSARRWSADTADPAPKAACEA